MNREILFCGKRVDNYKYDVTLQGQSKAFILKQNEAGVIGNPELLEEATET